MIECRSTEVNEMPKYWALICPDHQEPGLWKSWLANNCLAVGWTPARYRFAGPTDDKDWKTNREYLLEMVRGDIIIPYLCKWRFGTPAEVERLRVTDAEWNPTVRVRHYGASINHGEPGLGRRILVNWLTEGVPPSDKIARVPTHLHKSNPHGMVSKTIVPVTDRIALFMGIINNEENWEPYE
jgi:hypothetical protein